LILKNMGTFGTVRNVEAQPILPPDLKNVIALDEAAAATSSCPLLRCPSNPGQLISTPFIAFASRYRDL
jgi:hypothetical protein